MSEVTVYGKPFPAATNQARPDQQYCPSRSMPWLCTRPAGHDGDHEAAGVSGRKFASWPAEPDGAS